MSDKFKHLTNEEQEVIFERMKQNKNDRWKPIIVRAPRYTSGIKEDWSWKPPKKNQ